MPLFWESKIMLDVIVSEFEWLIDGLNPFSPSRYPTLSKGELCEAWCSEIIYLIQIKRSLMILLFAARQKKQKEAEVTKLYERLSNILTKSLSLDTELIELINSSNVRDLKIKSVD